MISHPIIKTDILRSKYIPARKKSEKLLIVLHGRGDSMRPFYKFQEELKLYEVNFLLLNAPRRFLKGWTWYGEPPYEKTGVLKIRQKLFELIADLEVQGWQSENIYLFGFSQGCLISADFGLNYPRRLGGIIGISGYFHFFPRWRSKLTAESLKTPWMFTHGPKDDVLNITETKHGVDKLVDAGLNVKWVEFDKDHVLQEEEYPVIRSWLRQQFAKKD